MAKMEAVGCAACGSNESEVLFIAKDPNSSGNANGLFTMAKCRACGLVFVNPRPVKEALPGFYGSEYYGKKGNKFNFAVEFFVRLFRGLRAREVMKIKPVGAVLDIGCGRGQMLALLRERGWDATGTELSDESAAAARSAAGVKVFTGSIEDIDLGAEMFDVVTMWHVFEHLPYPKETLARVHKSLKKGGELIISVPNFASLQSAMSGTVWFHLDVPRHLYQFTPETLSSMLEKNGFRIKSLKYTSLEYNYFGMIQSIYNAFGIRQNALYNLIRGAGAKLGGAGAAGVFLTVFLAPVVFPVGILASFIADFTRYGGNITVRAAKD